jgi:hypothetical protein
MKKSVQNLIKFMLESWKKNYGEAFMHPHITVLVDSDKEES